MMNVMMYLVHHQMEGRVNWPRGRDDVFVVDIFANIWIKYQLMMLELSVTMA